MAEFAFNNQVNKSIGVTPFYANYSYHPTMGIVPSAMQNVPEAATRIEEIGQVQVELKAALETSQEIQKQNYNEHVREQPQYNTGNQVFLSHANITTDHLSPKLDFQRLGPFPIKAKISNHAYRLTLPEGTRIHPVFHILLLTPH
ncbi:hypothetical protein FRB99_003655 [Tulasnella sp. 403]|nr:hypothetical protein FRB99_003655 [Tulasnella sp. 403]